MKRILLDTNIPDFLTQNNLEILSQDVKFYVSLISIMEFNFGFKDNQKIKEIDSFLDKYNVSILGNMFLLDEEIRLYPLNVDIDSFVRARGGIVERDLFNHEKFQKNLKLFYELIQLIYDQRIPEIKNQFLSEDVEIEDTDKYHSRLKKWIGKSDLEKLPQNALLRAFIFEKFILKRKYTKNDIRDLLICILAPYFDEIITDSKNVEIIKKIIHKHKLGFIFRQGFKIYSIKDIR